MNQVRSLFLALSAASLALMSGCASNPSNGAQPSSAAGKPAATKSMPGLKVVVSCGGCDVPDDVPGLIQEGYANAAKDAGAVVSSASTATVTITSLTYRSAGARIAAGAFAGKDEIKAKVAYKDKQFEVEDYYRNAWQGISSLARKIGGMAYEKLQ